MLKDVEQLLKVQKKDVVILELNWRIDLIPKRLREDEDHCKEMELQLEEAKKDKQAKVLQRKDLEGKSEQLQTKVAKYETQLNAVKTNQEYKAITEEIAMVKADNAHLEDQTLQAMEAIEEVSARVTDMETKVKEAKTAFEEEKVEVTRDQEIMRKELEEVKKQRNEFAQEVSPAALKLYERIFANKKGEAVVELKANVCQGCHMSRPHNVTLEVMHEKEIIQCENCARILYIEPHVSISSEK